MQPSRNQIEPAATNDQNNRASEIHPTPTNILPADLDQSAVPKPSLSQCTPSQWHRLTSTRSSMRAMMWAMRAMVVMVMRVMMRRSRWIRDDGVDQVMQISRPETCRRVAFPGHIFLNLSIIVSIVPNSRSVTKVSNQHVGVRQRRTHA